MRRKDRSPAGTRNHNARLTEEAVVEIRERYAAGGISQLDLGAEFGVSEYAVWRILRRRGWTHVEEEAA